MRHLLIYDMIEAVMRAGSIRRAAEDLNITASALNRRINGFEAEFGFEIFERLPRGMRLNPAGELLLQHIRAQRSDMARVQSQISDLSGERRGHVSIACSQALLPYFLPREIARYRAEHPGVSFDVKVRDRIAAERELSAFRSDLALVFEPQVMVDFEVLAAIAQPIHAIMRADHPLARMEELRLRDCLAFPHLVPSEDYAVRILLEQAVAGRTMPPIAPVVESDSFDFMRHYVEGEDVIAFQFPIGIALLAGGNLVSRPLSGRDVAPGNLLLGQMRARTLPVASAKFARQLQKFIEQEDKVRNPPEAASRPD